MNKVIRIITDVLIIITILLLSIYLILRYTHNIAFYKVMTGSMENNIHVGDYILIKKCDEYKKGDIVTYEKDGYYITHRIIKINKDTVITKGDANNVPDEEINKSNIIGKYIFKSKIINYIFDYKYIIICLIVFLFIISEILNRKNKEVKEVK